MASWPPEVLADPARLGADHDEAEDGAQGARGGAEDAEDARGAACGGAERREHHRRHALGLRLKGQGCIE